MNRTCGDSQAAAVFPPNQEPFPAIKWNPEEPHRSPDSTTRRSKGISCKATDGQLLEPVGALYTLLA